MAYIPIYTKKFRKSLKKFQKAGKFKNEELKIIIGRLINNKPLEPKHRDHELNGEYYPCRECHVQNDILLVYELDEINSLITFANLGTHSELF